MKNKLFAFLNGLPPFRGLNQQEFSWVLYDVGNSAYTMLACSLIPIWFKNLAIGEGAGQISGDRATAYYSLAVSIVTIMVALIGPIIGALADRKDRRKIFFRTAMAAGAIRVLSGEEEPKSYTGVPAFQGFDCFKD